MTSKRAMLGILIGFVVLIVSVGLVVFRSTSFLPFFKANENDVGSAIIAKVGQEELYQKDFDYEYSIHPQKDNPQIKSIILNKMILDSVILQGAQADGLLTLDSSVFNSKDKLYSVRVSTVDSVKELLESKSDKIEGDVVSIWYHNNSWIGPKGLEASKQIARQKITDLHAQVVAKKITIQEAGQMIKNDSSLAEVDRAYKNNAILHFEVLRSDARPITLSRELDSALWNLPVGGVSDVYTGFGTDLDDTSKSYEALYAFGQVSNRQFKGVSSMSYDEWVASKKKLYTAENIKSL